MIIDDISMAVQDIHLGWSDDTLIEYKYSNW